MRYSLDQDIKPELILKANDIELDDRWILHNDGYFMKNEIGRSISAFVKTKSGDKALRRTILALCEDTFLERTVLAKTVCYDERDLGDTEAVKLRRSAIQAQIDILNSIGSNMLPEPLDFFVVTNDHDKFRGDDAGMLIRTEPVLILDYIPGDVLTDKLHYTWDKSFYRVEDGKDFIKSPATINLGMIMRLAGDILAFEMELYEKGFAYTALSPDHIVLLGDNKPRFVGLGRICPINADRYDSTHINFGRQLKGYGAPEFNRKETGFGKQSSVKAAIAYNLGVLIACIMLNKTEFNEQTLDHGAYDYINSTEDRNAIKAARYGDLLDKLICALTHADPSRRMADFEKIMQELIVISGDAKKETKRDPVLYGTIKFFRHDQGYGYVTCEGEDYRVNFKWLDNIPSGVGDQSGQAVTFTAGINRNGQKIVKAFVAPPRTDVKFPQLVKIQESARSAPQPKSLLIPRPVPRPQPTPPPQPLPRPQSTPQPTPQLQPTKKKGLLDSVLDWLAGQ